MEREGYRVTAEFEESHWWFRSRRDLVARQVHRAASERGFPERRLRLLDYGCGTGRNLALLEPFGEVLGADVPSAHGSEFLKVDSERILDLRADLREYDARFDVLTALDVLEHTDDDAASLREMSRLLAPGGALVITVPAYRWLWSGEDEISRHRRRYDRRTLAAACGRAGLEIRFLSYVNLSILPAMAAVVWARRLLGRDGAPRSNLQPTPRGLDSLLYGITSLEARAVGAERLRLPAGASLVCRCVTSR